LQATRLIIDVEKRFGVDLPVSLLAERPTLTFMAELIDGAHSAGRSNGARLAGTEREQGTL